MKKNDLFIPMQPIDWTELSSGLTKLAADIPLATEEEHDYEDYKPLDCFASREEPALSKHPKKKNWKKRLRKAEEKFQAKQQELTHAQKELESWQLHAAGLLSAVAQERRARNQAELENTSRQVALIMSEAIRRGQAAEALSLIHIWFLQWHRKMLPAYSAVLQYHFHRILPRAKEIHRLPESPYCRRFPAEHPERWSCPF